MILKKIHGMNVAFKKSTPVEKSNYPGLHEESYILKKGKVLVKGSMPLMCDILVERDVAVTLRDGTIIRADIFRPVDENNCPVIMSWAPYGKRGVFLDLDGFGSETRMDVPRKWEDGLHAFEAPIPAYWVRHGYAVIQPDPRGVFKSEGDIFTWGTNDADDCCDMIAWAGEQPWSNGRVGLAGNSWLAMTQYFAAAKNPPHLAAIAPWEGGSDIYRDNAVRGGIPDPAFSELIISGLFGDNLVEDLPAMINEHPHFDEYWEDKAANLDQIKVPAYIVASWTNVLHTNGTFSAWENISSPDKWLRIHNTQEWTDFMTPAHMDDLRLFFDHYLKGIDNRWKMTPKIRMAVLDPGNRDVLNRVENEFPLSRQQIKALYLCDVESAGILIDSPPDEAANMSYDTEKSGELVFTKIFEEPTELTGYFNLKLWVETRSSDDIDIFAYIRKRDVNGVIQRSPVVTGREHIGPNGRLRVSLRKTDPYLSSELRPFMTFDESQKLVPGEIVPIEVGFWPYSIRWSAGETMELVITGNDPVIRADFPDLPCAPTINKGEHVIHFGGKYDSKLLIPLIPIN